MERPWKWVTGGINLRGEMSGWISRLDPADVGDFAGRVNRVAEIRAILRDARAAFAGGKAQSYRGAAEQLEDLLDELRLANEAWGALLGHAGEYLQPRIDLSALSDDDQQRFAFELTIELSKRLKEQAVKDAEAKQKALKESEKETEVRKRAEIGKVETVDLAHEDDPPQGT